MRRKAKALASTYRRRPRDIPYMLKVKKLPCSVGRYAKAWGPWVYAVTGRSYPAGVIPEPTTCQGRVEADHAGARGLNEKADDVTCIPICTKHHRERTDRFGTFAGWTKPQMRAWLDRTVEDTQREVEQMTHG